MHWVTLQKNLMKLFLTNGTEGKRLLSFKHGEMKYDKYVNNTFRGHIILANSFQEFYTETIEIVTSFWRDKKRLPSPAFYNETILWHLSNLRSLRAVDLLFHHGYPLDGFARLRHLKESALFLGAILSGLTTFSKVSGWNEGEEPQYLLTWEDYAQIKRNRKTEEKRILDLMIRKNSGLPEKHIKELVLWEFFFDIEVHGARLTYYCDIIGDNRISIVPVPKKVSLVMFINRFCEVAWMLHRTLPGMQLSNRGFNSSWKNKWVLLDENFLEMERSLARTGIKIAEVFQSFIQSKFKFNQNTCYDRRIPD